MIYEFLKLGKNKKSRYKFFYVLWFFRIYVGIESVPNRDHKKLNPVTIRSGPDPGPDSVQT